MLVEGGIDDRRRRAMVMVGAVAAVKLAVHVLVLEPYGWFRDELYYVACSDRLALGYVDHPPLSVAVLRVWRAAFGDSLAAIRLVPALAGAAVVALAGALAMALGGGALAAVLASVAVLAAPIYLGFDHTYSMNALDGLFWTLAALMLVRALEAPRLARWAWLGVVLGLGLLNKWSVLWLGTGVLAGLLLTPERRHLKSPGPWLAGTIALLLFAPHVAWQMAHGWPTLEFMRNAMGEKYVKTGLLAFLGQQVAMMGPATVPLSMAGLALPLSGRAVPAARVIAWMFLVTLVIVLASRSGKAEYMAAAYPMLFAAGAAALERALSSRAFRWAAASATVAMIAIAAVAAPFVLPVLSRDRFMAYSRWLGVAPATSEKKELGALPQHYADMHGWDELVAGASAAYGTLSPEERTDAVVWAVTGGYGSAAAIDVLGRRVGLPRAVSGHNHYWMWGPGGDPRVVILLGGERERLERLFSSVTLVTTVECGDCMPYENHKPVYVGRAPKRLLSDIWPEIKHYD
jgi:hypothetical protein